MGAMASKEGDSRPSMWAVKDSDAGGGVAPGGSWVDGSDRGEAAVGEGGDSSTADDGKTDGVRVGGGEIGNFSHGAAVSDETEENGYTECGER